MSVLTCPKIDCHNHVIDPARCTECVGAEDEPQCKLVCPADCIVVNPDFQESPEELMAKYESLHG